MQTNFLKQHPATGRIYLRDVITVAFLYMQMVLLILNLGYNDG